MFLTRRSGLESVARYVDEPRREQLVATDEGFAETLRLNTKPVRSARNAPRGAIMTRLPAHWWWRGGPDASATPPP
jgi:hypothetical protein